jgi:hypothetical protein
LIQNSDQNVIDLVRDLVVSHIQSENTLILITIPMSGEQMQSLSGRPLTYSELDDIENQQAVLLAKEADPYGERTIGIIPFFQ